MTNDDNSKNDIERLMDGLKSAKDWYDSNKDLFSGAKATMDTIDMETPEPLTEAHVRQDQVKIVAEVHDSDVNEMAVGFSDGKMSCSVGGREFVVDVPDDVDEDSIDAAIKNGVLSVRLDRIQQDKEGIEVTTEEETGETVEELFGEVQELDEDNHKVDGPTGPDTDEDSGGDDDGSDE